MYTALLVYSTAHQALFWNGKTLKHRVRNWLHRSQHGMLISETVKLSWVGL